MRTPNLPPAVADQLRQHAVEPRNDHGHGEAGERADKIKPQPLTECLLFDHGLHGHKIVERKSRRDSMEDRAHLCCYRNVAARFDDETHDCLHEGLVKDRSSRNLLHGKQQIGQHITTNGFVCLVADDANDTVGFQHPRVFVQVDQLAQRILARQKFLDERFVHYGDKRRRGCVAILDHAPAHHRSTHGAGEVRAGR
jgi:hypothetical protein